MVSMALWKIKEIIIFNWTINLILIHFMKWIIFNLIVMEISDFIISNVSEIYCSLFIPNVISRMKKHNTNWNTFIEW